jgi:hypothetical protein
MSTPYSEEEKKEAKRTWKPTLAGILLAICAIMALLFGITLLSLSPEMMGPMPIAGYGTLEGKVIDWETLEGIEEATCRIEEIEEVAVTDAEGNFIIEDIPVGGMGFDTYILRVSKSNYQTVEVKVGVILSQQVKRNPQLQTKEIITLRLLGQPAPEGIKEGKTMNGVNMMISSYRMGGGLSVGGAIAAIVGTIFVFKRQKLAFAMICSALATVLPILGAWPAAIPAAGGLILILLARDEFIA